MAEERVPLEIRRAEPEDAAELLSIYAPYVEESWVTFECVPPTVEEFRRRMEEFSRHYPYLVCCRAGEILGYAYAHRHMEREAYQWNAELTVYVRRGREGLGIGTALYGALIPKLREMGLVNLYGVLGLPNPGSEALHRRFGFTRQGLYPRMGFKLGEWHDVAQYGLRLTPPDRPPEPLFGQKGGRRDDLEVSAADLGLGVPAGSRPAWGFDPVCGRCAVQYLSAGKHRTGGVAGHGADLPRPGPCDGPPGQAGMIAGGP